MQAKQSGAGDFRAVHFRAALTTRDDNSAPATRRSPREVGQRWLDIRAASATRALVALRPTHMVSVDHHGFMSVDDNRNTIRAAFEAWQSGTHAIAEVFADDMVWRIEGHSFASREYANKQQFVDEVLAPFGARFVDGDAFRPVNIRSVLADGDTVAVVWDGRGVANDGKAYENSYAWIMRMRDGKVVDGTAFYDSISFNELWTRVAPAS